MSNSSKPSTDEVLKRVMTHLGDSMFFFQLTELLNAQDRRLQQEARTFVYCAQLRAADATDERVKLLRALAQRGGSAYYAPHEWVPHPFEEMERHGLVHCQHGSKDQSGRDSRVLEITEAGQLLVAELQPVA